MIDAAAGDPVVAARLGPLRERLDELVAELLSARASRSGIRPPTRPESARALNRLTEGYLMDVFGREAQGLPRGRDPDPDARSGSRSSPARRG